MSHFFLLPKLCTQVNIESIGPIFFRVLSHTIDARSRKNKRGKKKNKSQITATAEYEIKTKSVWNFFDVWCKRGSCGHFFLSVPGGVLLRVHTESESIIREAF